MPDSRSKYERPGIVDFPDELAASGACRYGASPGGQCQSGTAAMGGKCQHGSAAGGGKCQSGSAAAAKCQAGSAAGAKCQTGSTPFGG